MRSESNFLGCVLRKIVVCPSQNNVLCNKKIQFLHAWETWHIPKIYSINSYLHIDKCAGDTIHRHDFVGKKKVNLVFATHGEEDEIYPLTIIEIAEAQKKDQNLKIYYK